MLLCPVCHEPLVDDERGAACAGGHRFDRAREGYLYLLRSSKSGDSMGDPKSQARSRRDFLNRGLLCSRCAMRWLSWYASRCLGVPRLRTAP